jgi:hypothetical protein
MVLPRYGGLESRFSYRGLRPSQELDYRLKAFVKSLPAQKKVWDFYNRNWLQRDKRMIPHMAVDLYHIEAVADLLNHFSQKSLRWKRHRKSLMLHWIDLREQLAKLK